MPIRSFSLSVPPSPGSFCSLGWPRMMQSTLASYTHILFLSQFLECRDCRHAHSQLIFRSIDSLVSSSTSAVVPGRCRTLATSPGLLPSGVSFSAHSFSCCCWSPLCRCLGFSAHALVLPSRRQALIEPCCRSFPFCVAEGLFALRWPALHCVFRR